MPCGGRVNHSASPATNSDNGPAIRSCPRPFVNALGAPSFAQAFFLFSRAGVFPALPAVPCPVPGTPTCWLPASARQWVCHWRSGTSDKHQVRQSSSLAIGGTPVSRHKAPTDQCHPGKGSMKGVAEYRFSSLGVCCAVSVSSGGFAPRHSQRNGGGVACS